MQIKKQSTRSTPKNINKKTKFPFGKVLDFNADKFN